MKLIEAIEIVLQLARQNLAPEDVAEQRERQIDACNTLEDFAVNQLGEEE
jgi:hypothetical protein